MSAATATVVTRRQRMTSRGVAWGVVGIVILGLALLCWNQIARTLGAPIYVEFSGVNDSNLPVPAGGTATVTDYGTSAVSASLTHVSVGLQWLIAGGIVVQFVLLAAVLLTAGILWAHTREGKPFAHLVIVSLFTLAGLVAVLGVGLEVLNSLTYDQESIETFGADQSFGYGLNISGLSILIGLCIAMLASAFLVGAKLSRDTEGLV
jgi:hypothetical protein